VIHVRAGLALGLLALLVVGDAAAETRESDPEPIQWGMGAKVRHWYVSEGLQHLFVEDSPGAASNDGAGLDFARRSGKIEITVGFGFDRLDGPEGYYLEKGADPTVAGKVDYVTYHDLQMFTAEVTVVNHVQLHKFLELRFGAGLGIGVVRGEMHKTDALCTGSRLAQDCMIDPAAMEVDQPADLPPVLPVVNALVGLEVVPFRFLHVYVDAGLHTAPYVGAGATLYLW